MTIFDQDIKLDHLPKDLKGLYEILVEIDKILHKEGSLIKEERRMLKSHKNLLAEFKDITKDKHTKSLISAMAGLAHQLSEVHEKISWTEWQLHFFEKQLKTTKVVEWNPEPLLDFLNELQEQMQFEENELYDEKQLVEHFKACVEHESQPLSGKEKDKLKEVLDFLRNHSSRLFRLQRLILNTISLIGE